MDVPQKIPLTWVVSACIYMVLAGCGENSSPTANSPEICNAPSLHCPGTGGTTLTEVSIAPELLANVGTKITQIIGPDGTTQLGDRLPIQFDTPSEEVLVLALDTNNETWLGAVTSTSDIRLDSQSTAIAFTRIALIGLADKSALDNLNNTIVGMPEYSQLVSAINKAIEAAHPPYSDPLVVSSLVAVVNQILTPSKKTDSLTLESTTYPLASLPVDIVPDTLFGVLEVELLRSAGSSVQLNNQMPISWESRAISSTATVTTALLKPSSGISLEGSWPGFSVVVGQSDSSKKVTLIDIGTLLINSVLEFVDAPDCSSELVSTGIGTAIDGIRESNGFEKEFDLSDVVELGAGVLEQCADHPDAILFLTKRVAAIVQAWSTAKAAFNASTVVVKVEYAQEFWGASDRGLTVCVSSIGQSHSCASKYLFYPAALLMAPEAKATLEITALDSAGHATLPAEAVNLGFESSNIAIATIDPGGTVIASSSPITGALLAAGGGRITGLITVLDSYTGASGKLPVTLVAPQVAPASLSVGRGDTVRFALEDGQGGLPLLPDGVSWTVDPVNQLTVTPICLLTCSQNHREYEVAAMAIGGTITVTAKDPHGVEYGHAQVAITDDVCTVVHVPALGAYGGFAEQYVFDIPKFYQAGKVLRRVEVSERHFGDLNSSYYVLSTLFTRGVLQQSGLWEASTSSGSFKANVNDITSVFGPLDVTAAPTVTVNNSTLVAILQGTNAGQTHPAVVELFLPCASNSCTSFTTYIRTEWSLTYYCN